MASHRVEYQIGFSADTQALTTALNQALQSLQKIGTSPTSQLTTQLRGASEAALDLANNLRNAYNQETGKLDLVTFNNSLKQSNKSLQDYADSLIAIGPSGEKAFLNVAQAISKAELPLKRTNKLANELWVSLKNAARWQISASVLHGFMGSLSTAYGYTKDLNESLNSIRIVTGKNTEEMGKFAESANKAAKALSTTTVDYTDASLIYYQQGLTDEEVQGRTETTIKLANVAGESAQAASEQLTAIWNNFYDGSKSLEYYADVMTALGAATASSTQEISAGLQKFAAVADSVGLSYEYATAALATITATTRESADVVGTSLRTLFARIQGLSQDETQDDGTTLNKYSKALAQVGIDIKDTSGEMRNMNDILDEMGEKWDSLSKSQQLALAQTVAGVRQYSQLIALMDNWDFFEENRLVASGAEGTLEEQAEIYAESWEAARDRVRAATEDIYDSLINENFFIGLDDVFTPILSGAADVIDALGGMKGALTLVAVAMTSVYGDKIAQGMRDFATNIGIITGLESQRSRELQKQATRIAEDLTISMAANKQSQLRLSSLKEEIVLQGTINESMESLDASQKQWVENEQYGISLLKQNLEELINTVGQYEEKFNTTKQTLFTDIRLEPNWQDSIRQEIKNYNQTHRDNKINLGIDINTADSEEAFNKITSKFEQLALKSATINRIKQSLAGLNQEAELSDEDLARINRQLEELGIKPIQNISQVSEAMATLSQESVLTAEQMIVLKNVLSNFGGTDQEIKSYIVAVRKLAQAEDLANISSEEFRRRVEELANTIKNGAVPSVKDWATYLTNFASILSRTVMAANALNSVARVFEDSDMTAWERAITLLTSMSMLLPVVAGLIGLLNTQKKISITLDGTQVVATTKVISAKVAEKVATILVTKSMDADTAATKLNTAAKIANNLVLVAIVAAAAAVAYAIYKMVEAYNADADAAKRASEQVEILTDSFNKCKTAAEELKSSISDYQDGIDALKNLDSQTEEYKETLEETNKKAKELIETYKLWNQYSMKGGLITFDEGVLEDAQDKADAAVRQAESALLTSKINASQLELVNEMTQASRGISGVSTGVNSNQTAISKTTDYENNVVEITRTWNEVPTTTLSNTTQDQLKSLIDYWKSTATTPITDEALVAGFNKIVPGLNLTIDALDSFVDRLSSLSNSIDNIVEQNEYYSKEILQSTIEESNQKKLKEIAGDNEVLYTSLVAAMTEAANVAATEGGQTFAEVLSSIQIDKASYESAEALSQFLGGSSQSDEEFARQFALVNAPNVNLSEYEFSSKGNFFNFNSLRNEGETLFDQNVSFDEMRRFLALYSEQQKELEKLFSNFNQEDYTAGLEDFIEGASNLNDFFKNIDFTTLFADILANRDFEDFDLTELLPQFTPEDFSNILNMSPEEFLQASGIDEEAFERVGFESGEAFAKSFYEALNDTDNKIAMYQGWIQQAESEATSIGGLLTSYQNEEDLDDDQQAFLDGLVEKYENLAEARENGGHEYLALLRQIREEDEALAIQSLENLKAEQQNKLAAAQQDLENIKALKDEMDSDDWEIEVTAKTEAVEEALNDLINTDREISIKVNADLATDVEDAFGLAAELDKLQSYVADELTITYDQAQQIIADGYGAMLQNAKETSESLIEVDKNVMNNYIDTKQAELEADRQAKIQQLENQKIILLSEKESLQAKLVALKEAASAENANDAALALAKAQYYQVEADAKANAANLEMQYAEDANEEISEDAERLADFLGQTYEINAENAQQSNADANTAAQQYVSNAINYANQLQEAYVKVSDAVRQSATGNAVYTPIKFSGGGTVKVGATKAKAVSSSYERTNVEVDPTELANQILEQANGNLKAIQEVAKQQIEDTNKAIDLIDSQIGAADVGIAALKSAGLSLDKAQKKAARKTKDSGSSKDNTGKEYDAEEKKDLEEVLERYHEITREIELQSKALDKVGNEVERAYGVAKIRAYKNELNALQRQQDNYNKKLAEANKYLAVDTADLQARFGNAAILDGMTGEILNYTELLTAKVNEYNAFIDAYNKEREEWGTWTKDQQEANEKLIEQKEAEFEKKKEIFELDIGALKQYEETIDTRREIQEELDQIARDMADNRLSQIEYRLEVVLDVKSLQDSVRNLKKEIQEIFNDALTHGIAVADVTRDQAKADMALLPEYIDQFSRLKAEYESADKFVDRDRIIKDIQELQGNVIDTAEALVEWWDSIEDIMPDMLDAAAERYKLFTDQLEHNTTVLDTIKELYALQGVTYKTMDGFNKLQRTSQEKLEAQVAQAQIERGRYDELKVRLAEAQARLDSLGGDETNPLYDTYKKARDAFLEQFNEAEEAYLSLAKEAMETAKEMYLEQIDKAVYDFGQKVSKGLGLDLLQDKYNHYIEEEGRYFDKINEGYQTVTWYNKLQQDIDKTTNAAHRDRLKALQQEIDARRENNKLSQYDLDILNAKYNILQAQMALEDAQNAKNQLRLVRDRQGNWNYQYTADPTEVEDKEQAVLDAMIDYYNIAKDRLTEINGEIVDLYQEASDKISEIYANDLLTREEKEAKALEVKRYYAEKIKYLEEEKQIAIKDMNEAGAMNTLATIKVTGKDIAGVTNLTADQIKDITNTSWDDILDVMTKGTDAIGDILGDATDFIDVFDNTYAKDLDDMTVSSEEFVDALDTVLDECRDDFENFGDVVADVADKVGVAEDDLVEKTEEVSDATDELSWRAEDAADAIWNMVDAAQDAVDSYLEMADAIWEAVNALQAMAQEQANYVEEKADLGNEDWHEPVTDYSYKLAQKWLENPNSVFSPENDWLWTGRAEKRGSSAPSLTNDQLRQVFQRAINEDQEAIQKIKEILASGEKGSVKFHTQFPIASFDTGGYTGDFQDAKLAYLHAKELVLNSRDTENILAAVDVVRKLYQDNSLTTVERGRSLQSIKEEYNTAIQEYSDIMNYQLALWEKALDDQAQAAKSLMADKVSGFMTKTEPIIVDQTIHIDEVSFPNISSSDGLKEAFASLANDALQWAKIRRF